MLVFKRVPALWQMEFSHFTGVIFALSAAFYELNQPHLSVKLTSHKDATFPQHRIVLFERRCGNQRLHL